MDVNRLYIQLGVRIAQLRKKAGLNQEQLAQILGLSRTSMTNIERGRQRLQIHSLLAIAKALQLPPSGLLDGLSASGEADDLPPEAKALAPEAQAWVSRIAARMTK